MSPENQGVLQLLKEVTYKFPKSTSMTLTAFDPDGTLYGMLQGFGARGGM